MAGVEEGKLRISHHATQPDAAVWQPVPSPNSSPYQSSPLFESRVSQVIRVDQE
jgi:hypothetical protein